MKKRLDNLLVERGLVVDLKEAVARIMAGEVLVEHHRADKPGLSFDPEVIIALKPQPRFVSRGGDKLASVTEKLGLEFTGKVVLDVGSSTGGFTDYALQNGAAKVYAVDVGRGQLDYRLRQDPRVVVMEETDVRSVETLPEPVDLVLIDVSFISLHRILSSIIGHLSSGGLIVAMVKPQFEASKKVADRFKGVIKDQSARELILNDFEEQISDHFQIVGQADSGLAGAKGNIERFYVLKVKH